MKSMERAKSFVASRSASNKYRPKDFSARNQRSNSLSGGRPKKSCPIEMMDLHPEEAITSMTNGKSHLEASKVSVQLSSMQDRVAAIDRMLHSLQELSTEMDQEAIVDLASEIATHAKIVRNSLIFLCRSYLLEKQIAILVSVQDQMYPTFDISVRFFGIDWGHIFRVSYNLVHCVDLMAEALVNDTSTDVLLPSNILRNLATIEADVSSHAEAVSQGRLSANATAKEPEKEPQHLSVSGEETEETVKKGWQMVEDWKKRLRKAIRLPTSVSVHSYLGRHANSRSESGLIDKRARSHHDELWRAWYNGLQTITIPAASASFKSTTSCSLCLPATSLEAIDASAESPLSKNEDENDESFDSLTLTLTMTKAPKQEVAESKL